MGFFFAKPTTFQEPMLELGKVSYYAVDHTLSYLWESASRSISAALIVHLPTVVGGPYSRYGNAWTSRYPWQVLAKNGFAGFIVNPRRGTGYGAEFLQGVYRNLGTDDFQDIMAAVDALAERGTIDPDRLGFTGYSYGGLMTNVVINRTDRFKAAVSIVSIWNYTSPMGQNNSQLLIDSYNQPAHMTDYQTRELQ